MDDTPAESIKMTRTTADSLPLRERAAYSLAEVAQLTGLARRTIQDAVSRGELKAVRRCRRWIVRRESLQSWLSADE